MYKTQKLPKINIRILSYTRKSYYKGSRKFSLQSLIVIHKMRLYMHNIRKNHQKSDTEEHWQ